MIDETIEQTIEETKEEKWSRECLAQGFKFIGKSLENKNYSIAECLTCGHVDSYQQSAIRKGEVRCSKCLETKYSNECLANGFKYLGKSSDNSEYSIAECLTCSHVDSYTQDNIRKGNVRCSKCLETKYSNECLAQGFKYLGKSLENSSYTIVECLTCTHVDSYQQSAIRKGEVRCSKCLETKYSNECLAQGFKYLGKSLENKNYSITECLTCTHVGSYQQKYMRDGRVRCESCLINKYKSLVKPGWEYIDKAVIKNKTYIVLKHDCSDNLVTVQSSAFLNGVYDCPHCMHSHFDDPSYFYTIKITHNNQTLIKIGISNNPYQRFKQYGLPESATLEIIHVKPFPTKRLAIAFESFMKQQLQDFKIDNDLSKTILKESGHTEAFTADSLDIINQII